MAFTSAGFEAEITYIDSGNNLSKQTIGVRGADIDAAETNMAAQINDFIACTDAFVQSYTVREKFVNGATRVPAGEVEEKAVVTVNLSTLPKKAILTIPAPKATMFAGAAGTDGYNQVQITTGPLAALLGDFLLTGGSFFISDGESLADTNYFVKGRRTHRASGRG